jgi:hypothetical protein
MPWLTWLEHSAAESDHVDGGVGAPQRDEHVQKQLDGLPVEQCLEAAVVDQIPYQHAAGDGELVREDDGWPRSQYDRRDDPATEAAENGGRKGVQPVRTRLVLVGGVCTQGAVDDMHNCT